MRAYLERINTNIDSSIHGLHLCADRFTAPWHFHPEFELTYIQRGAGLRHAGDSIEPFAAGDLALLGPNLPHRWESVGKVKNSAQALVLQWPAGLLPAGPEFFHLQTLLNAAQTGLVFTSAQNAAIGARMRHLLDKEKIQRFQDWVGLLDALSALDSRQLTAGNYLYDSAEDSHSKLNQAQRFVQENFHRKLTLAEVSTSLEMSEQKFSRFFQRVMNRTFFTYVTEYRLLQASQALTASQLPIANIAKNCGLPSLPLFHKKFRQQHGCTPLQYRTKARQKKSPG